MERSNLVMNKLYSKQYIYGNCDKMNLLSSVVIYLRKNNRVKVKTLFLRH
jgi:hypothetical protein